MKYVHVFATANDIDPLLKRLDEAEPLKYIEVGKKESINRPIYLSSAEIPNKGIATNESGSLSIAYLVSPREIKNSLQAITQTDGSRAWLLSNGNNPDSVVLTMGGLWTTGTLLDGYMSTLHTTGAAQRIMRRFLAAVRAEQFVKYNVFWLGREAMDWLGLGRRLVQSEQSPRTFDIPPPAEWPTGGG